MRALVYTAPGVVELMDVDEPVVQQGEVLLDVELVGICGSELHGISKPGFRTPPLVMGHEFVGTDPRGRRVAVNPLVPCGACDRCADDHPHLCRVRAIVGIHRAGAFAERIAVPESLLHELPSLLPWEAAAVVEPLANGLHAWGVAGKPVGQRVAVIGAGTIGLVSLLVALDQGAGEVVVVDLSEERLAQADRLGAVTARELTGEFDVVIDAVGAPATHHASVARVRPGGTAVWLGLMSDAAAFDSLDLVRQEKSVRGSFCYTDAEFGEAIALAGRCAVDWTRTFPLEEGAVVFTELMNGRSDIVKALLKP